MEADQPKYRDNIPNILASPSSFFLTEGGTETTILYLTSFPLREFCAFELLLTEDPKFKNLLYDEYAKFCQNAVKSKLDILIDLVTWRLSRDWLVKLGYKDIPGTMKQVVKKGMELVAKLRNDFEKEGIKIVCGGEMGPRYDGYTVENRMSIDESWRYHRETIKALRDGGVDVMSCLTMTTAAEAAGIARACAEFGMHALISFTVELDGKLPSGETLQYAIETVEKDGRWEGRSPVLFFMINCAHWELVDGILKAAKKKNEAWVDKIKGLRANSSRKSHEELDRMTTLDEGDPPEWGKGMAALKRDYGMHVLGGCCGTSATHQGHLATCLTSS